MRFFLFLFWVLGVYGAGFDVLVRRAKIVDGTGNPWYAADLAIKAGRIAAIGDLMGSSAELTIEAAGRIAVPGFTNVHTHIEDGIERVPGVDHYLMDGVTSVVTGSRGGSRPDLAAWVAGLERTGMGISIAALAGHKTVREQAGARRGRILRRRSGGE